MPLNLPPEWLYGESGIRLSNPTFNQFIELINRIASIVPNPKSAYEVMKQAFGDSTQSSNGSWAESDMNAAMGARQGNAPLFISNYWTGLQNLREFLEVQVPDDAVLNRILSQNNEPFRIDAPKLIHLGGDVQVTMANSDDDDNDIVPRYQIVGEIGKGGFGVVHRVRRRTAFSTFDFAMKVLDPLPFNNLEKAKQRFEREIGTLSKLQHRGIVPLLESGLTGDGKPYLLMQVIEGTDFRTATEGAAASYIAQIVLEMVHALEFAHANEVLHRDLKPANILVRSSDSQPVILDFGCAFMLDDFEGESLTTAGIGTLGYVPFEVVNNPKLRTPQHDVYSCGVLLYEAFARCLPDPQDYDPLARLSANLAPFDEVIIKAIAPARRRFTTVTELRTRLAEVPVVD